MIHPKPLSRESVDPWRIEDLMLPLRVVNALRGTNVKTAGELRAWDASRLKCIRGMGKVSIRDIQDFFSKIHGIENRKYCFDNIRQILCFLLTCRQLDVLTGRYGLAEKDLVASYPRATLQKLATRYHTSRQYIQQTEENAKARLRTLLAQAYLDAAYGLFEDLLKKDGGKMSCKDLDVLRGKHIGGLNPSGLLFLLSHCNDRIVFRNGLFSLPAETRR